MHGFREARAIVGTETSPSIGYYCVTRGGAESIFIVYVWKLIDDFFFNLEDRCSSTGMTPNLSKRPWGG